MNKSKLSITYPLCGESDCFPDSTQRWPMMPKKVLMQSCRHITYFRKSGHNYYKTESSNSRRLCNFLNEAPNISEGIWSWQKKRIESTNAELCVTWHNYYSNNRCKLSCWAQIIWTISRLPFVCLFCFYSPWKNMSYLYTSKRMARVLCTGMCV